MKKNFSKAGKLAGSEHLNHWIGHTGQRIWLIGMDANEDLFAVSDAPSDWEGDECHN